MSHDHYEAARYHAAQEKHHFDKSGEPGSNYHHHRQLQHQHSLSYHHALGAMAQDKGGGYRCAPNGDVWFNNGEVWSADKFK